MNIAFGFLRKSDMGSGSEKPRQEHDAEFMNSLVGGAQKRTKRKIIIFGNFFSIVRLHGKANFRPSEAAFLFNGF